MSSSEQAPEPTMDEILASIRKIISDDEPGDSPQTESPAAVAAAPAEGALADDLANALNDTQADGGATDDILDLTEVVPAPDQNNSPQSDASQVDALQAALGDAMAAPEVPAPVSEAPAPAAPEASTAPQAAPVPNPQEVAAGDNAGNEIDISAVLAEAGIEETFSAASVDPEPDTGAPSGDELSAALEQGDAAQPEPGSGEATSITDVLSSIDPLAADPVPEAAADAEMAEAPDALVDEPAPGAQPEASIDKGVYNPDPEPAATDAPEVSPADTNASNSASDVAVESAAEPGVMQADAPPELAAAVDAPMQDAAPVEDTAPSEEPEPVEAAAPGSDTGDGRTLEDSVKDMLRPMLREWLDDNMERIVQNEVSAENLKGSDG